MRTRDVRWLQLFGWSHTGKTRVLTAVIRLLAADGHRVLAVKHSHHRHAESEWERVRDTAAFLTAGAAAALLVAADGVWREVSPGSVPERAADAPLAAQIIEAVEATRPDWVVVEGGHAWGTPKVGLAGPTGNKVGAPPVLAVLGPIGEAAGPKRSGRAANDPATAAAWLLEHAETLAARVKDLDLDEALEGGPAATGIR